jgi:mitochondrial cardiolipin hydrolase
MSGTALNIEDILGLLAGGIADGRLSDDERRALANALLASPLRDEDLRRLRNHSFELVREHLSDPLQLALLKWLEGVVRTLDGSSSAVSVPAQEAAFSPGMDCLQLIQRALRSTRQTLDICVFTLSDDRIAEEILAAAQRGVKIRIITDNDKEYDAGSDISRLREAGIPVAVDRTSAHMHHKFAIFDGKSLINGSYNWTRSACSMNEENIVLSKDPLLIRQFSTQFDKLWQALSEHTVFDKERFSS